MHRATVGLLLFTIACATKSNGAPGDGSSNGMQACTEIGYNDGLVIDVTPASAWPQGSYTFTVEADGATTTCTGSLPLPECGQGALTCDGDNVQIGESGCALAPEEHAFGGISFATTPASVSVTVTHDGQAVGSESFTPTYQTSTPNGPGCPPTCTNAAVAMALSFD